MGVFFIYYDITWSSLTPPILVYFDTYLDTGSMSSNDTSIWKYLGAIFNSDDSLLKQDDYTILGDKGKISVVLINPIYYKQVTVPDNFMTIMRPTIDRLKNLKI